MAKAPEGSLTYQVRDGRVIYYHQTKLPKGKSWKKEYIRKSKLDEASELAKKAYYQNLRLVLNKQLNVLETFESEYEYDAIKQVYNRLPDERKSLIEPYNNEIVKMINAWKQEKYEPNMSYSENLIYDTEKGDKVRSKSELIIANTLYQYADVIDYKYERPLELRTKDGKNIVIHPDFTILNKLTGRITYYEHAGRMDDPKYAAEFVKKMNLYTYNNIIHGRNLVVTFETAVIPLDIGILRNIIQKLIDSEI